VWRSRSAGVPALPLARPFELTDPPGLERPAWHPWIRAFVFCQLEMDAGLDCNCHPSMSLTFL